MVKVLELFSGTRSIGKVCDKLGWESVSVDLIMEADHKCDIMDFDYKQYDKDEFDIVWASPPCTEYSQLKLCWINRKLKNGTIYTKEENEKDMLEADKLVLKTLEIINYFNCEYWFMENPVGRLKDREIMKDKFYHIVDYCMYSDWGYKKSTCIWTNKKDWKALRCNKKCGNMENGKHKNNLATSSYAIIDGKHKAINTAELRQKYKHLIIKNDRPTFSQQDRYRIPEDLIFSLFLD